MVYAISLRLLCQDSNDQLVHNGYPLKQTYFLEHWNGIHTPPNISFLTSTFDCNDHLKTFSLQPPLITTAISEHNTHSIFRS